METELKPAENMKFYFQLSQKLCGLGPGTSHTVTLKQEHTCRSTS